MSRMKLLRIKREEQLKVMKRNLAQILQSGQEQTARARVEHLYKEVNTIAAYDLLESFCEQIVARLPIIESQKKCPLDLEEPISSLLFASQRCAEIQEFTDVHHHFTSKYGKEFVSAAVELRAGSRVNRTVIEKLSAKTPDGQTKLKMLAAIAKEHNVDWDPHAVEEQVSDLPETKFAGPTEFISATKIIEFPEVPKHNPQTKVADHDTNIRPPEHPRSAPSTNISRASSSAQINSRNLSASDPGTSSANVAPDYQPRAPENVAADPFLDIKYKHEDLVLEKSRWHMQFKDATAAAKAAAESAEKASIAARAAAELSSLEKMSRQNSTESRKSGRGNIPIELLHLQLNKALLEGLANNNECHSESFHATDATFQRQVKDSTEKKPGRGYDQRNLNATHSRSGSSQSDFSSHEDELLASGAQWTESHCPTRPQQRETVNKKWQNHENVRDDLSEDGSVKKRPSQSHFTDSSHSTYCDSKTGTVAETFGVQLVDNIQRTEGHSPRSPPERETLSMKRLPSENEKYSLQGEGSFNGSTFNGSKTEVDAVIFTTANHQFSVSSTRGEDIFSREDTAKPVSTYGSGAVFDNSGSESESLVDLDDAVVESKRDSLVADARRSPNAVSSTLDPWRSREHGKESLKKDTYSIPSRSTDMQYRSSSSDRNVKATGPSPYYDPVSSTFDDSDGLGASSEEEANGLSPPIHRNVSSVRDRPPSSHIMHGPVKTASYSRNEVKEHKKKEAPIFSDSDDSFDGNTVSVSAYTPGGKGSVRSSVSAVKDQTRMNSLEPCSKRDDDLDSVTTTTFYTDTGGPEPSVDSDTECSSILKFDRLGGLRNKGYIRPPYRRNPSHISSSDVNSLKSEESLLSNAAEVPHTDRDKSVDPGESIIQGVGRGTRATLSSDFQEQRRISGSKTEMSASVEFGVSMKSRSPKKTSILHDEVLRKSLDQDAVSDGSGQTALKTKQVLKPSRPKMSSELQRGNDRSSASYNLDSDRSIDADTFTNCERGSRRSKVSAASVRTAGRSTPFPQSTTNRNPMLLDELDTTPSFDSSVSEESRHGRPVRGTHVEEQPRPISKTQKMEAKTPYDYVDPDSDEPIDTGSLLHQNLVSRRSKASASYMTAACENPPQAAQLGGPEIIKVDNPPHHSAPVSHVEDQPKHTTSTVASRSSKDMRRYGSEVANKGLKPAEPRRTLLENKEMKTSRTSYHDFGSDSDESTETRAHMSIKMVNRNSKDDSVRRTALQDNPPYQPSGAGPKSRAKVEVPDSKVSSTSLQKHPPETLPESQKQTKTAASDTSRSDVKPSGSSGPTTSRENSFQRASHVHPKLPDYDSLLEILQAARRESK
ncbi:IST1-like protein [Nymphaea thermarum]|nr:IST1-like protein [Nymphaea thermarum]